MCSFNVLTQKNIIVAQQLIGASSQDMVSTIVGQSQLAPPLLHPQKHFHFHNHAIELYIITTAVHNNILLLYNNIMFTICCWSTFKKEQ